MKHILTTLCLLALFMAGFGPTTSVSLAAPSATTFNVNTTTDAHDNNLSDGNCYNGIDGCSLRAAVEQAFSASKPVTIHFWSGIAGTLTLNLGMLTLNADDVTIDGQANNMTITGSPGNGNAIIRVVGNNNTLTNLTIRNSDWDGVQVGDFSGVGTSGNDNTISFINFLGNAAAGIYVHGSGSGGGQRNGIYNSSIGFTNIYGSSCVAGEGNGLDGIYINRYASSTTILSNWIGCNAGNGVYIDGRAGAPNATIIDGNDIGVNLTGAMPNGGQGVLDQQAQNTIVRGNIISGNSAAGVWLNDDSAAKVYANYIGTDANGIQEVANTNDGVAITDSATDNIIGGGTYVTETNIISGNGMCGVRIRDSAYDNTVNYNRIGLNAAGDVAIPNGQAGICIFNTGINNIGSSASGVTQFISGNTREGIYIEHSHDVRIYQSNFIGVATDKTTPVGNGMQGIMINSAQNTAVFPKLVAYNGGAGIAVIDDTATGNFIYPTKVYNNAGLPVDLGNDGATPNGLNTPPGPNNWLSHPVITGGNGTSVNGSAPCAGCMVLVYQAIGNPAAAGGGVSLLGTTTTDSSDNWTFTSSGINRSKITASVCNSPCAWSGDTSEFSPRPALYLPRVVRP